MVKALLIKGAEDNLKYLNNDINLIESAFKTIGIETTSVEGNKFVVLQSLSTIIDDLGSVDTLIVYYTGHGVIRSGKICFKLGNENKSADYLSVNELIENTTSAITNNIILVLDCCYAIASESAWKDYASDKHMLFLPSNKLESVEELEDVQSSFFTYCIYQSIMCPSKSLYCHGKITLGTLYSNVQSYAVQYNKSRGETKPIPELIGRISNDITLGYQTVQGILQNSEEIITDYIKEFVYCVEKCTRSCNENQTWCSTIYKSDVDIYKYVIPYVKDFLSNNTNNSLTKLNIFFDNWLKKKEKYLGILGDMGTGKTSACIYLFYYLSKKYLDNDSPYIPIYISLNTLKEYTKNGQNWYLTIQNYMSLKISVDTIKNLCMSGRMFFILDGFDEISGDTSISAILQNYEMIKPIMRFGCKTVLTCRTHYFSEQDQIEEVLKGTIHGTDFASTLLYDEYPFGIVELQEFTEYEILELISLLSPSQNNTEIWNEIKKIYDLRDLARRAILLKMIIKTLPELHKNKDKIDSTTLYMLYTRKLLRREIESRRIGIELSEKENFIGYIANLMFTNNELEIETRKFDKEISQYFSTSIYSKDELNNYNYDCKVSTFFIRDQQDNYKFMHKSFYEYYFALYCIRQMGDGNYAPWSVRWFQREIAYFITGLLEKKYSFFIPKIITTSLETDDEILIWNTLHILSLLDEGIVEKYLSKDIKKEYIERGQKDTRTVLIRQYCRIIAKFIDRHQAEELIEKILNIVRNNPDENEYNDLTYYNYYGGKNAACQAFLKHLSVIEPKYDATFIFT